MFMYFSYHSPAKLDLVEILQNDHSIPDSSGRKDAGSLQIAFPSS